MDERPTFVFGFGSLVDAPTARLSRILHADGYIGDLHGFRRTWDVAMDNRVTIPGYKYYVDPVTGERPDVFVTFVNLRSAAGASANGRCFPVTERQLAELDARERNYRRIDVSDAVEPNDGFRIYTYVGAPDACARYAEGAAAGSAVIHAGYHRLLCRAFERLGRDEARRFHASTDAPPCRLLELARMAVPLDGAGTRPTP